MQESYNNNNNNNNNNSTEENSLIIPECVNWNIINSAGPSTVNYRERLMNENSNSSYSNVTDVPVAHSFIRKRRQFQFKQIDNVSTNYESDDSDEETSFVNVPKTIKMMDILYNTNFYIQLRSEQNIITISHYLKNIINKKDDRRKNEVYSIKKIVNVLNWMMQDWKIESIAKVIVSITSGWTLNESNQEDSRLGRLIRKITVDWDPQYLAHLVSLLFTTHPLCNKDDESCRKYKEVFLKVLSKRWKFCRLSQFFICLGNKGTINHKLKVHLLQRAAKYEDSSKKMNFNFSNQRRKPVVMTTSQTQPLLHQPQPQFQVIPQSQSVDNIFQQNNQNQNQSPQLYQTVMILSPQSVNQGSPRSTPGQSPHATLYQIQDYQRPVFTQSPFNDTVSTASSTNSPASPTVSPSNFFNSSIPVITSTATSSTNIPTVTIRSMNHVMTMNTQPVPVVMSPPLNNYNSNSPPVIVSNITVPNTPSSGKAYIRLPQGASVIQTISPQGTPIQTSSVITITTPVSTTTTNIAEPNNKDSILLSPSTSSTSSFTPRITTVHTPNNINASLSSSSSSISHSSSTSPSTSPFSSTSTNHSKLKGKEINEEDNPLYHPAHASPINQPNATTRPSLLFMTPSAAYTPTIITMNTNNSTSQPLPTNYSNNSSSVNVSMPIPLSLNVRNINQKITELSKEPEINKEISTNGMTIHSIHQTLENKEKNIEKSELNMVSSSSSSSSSTSLKDRQKEKEKDLLDVRVNEDEPSASSSSSSSTISHTITVSKGKPEDNTDEETSIKTLRLEEEEEMERTDEYYEEIFNLDEFNHEEKKAIYDIIDSSKEDIEKIQMEKDEKIRNFIKENNQEFSNPSSSSSPKTPPPSLSSSPFFQK